MEKENLYACVFGLVGGLTNALSILSLGVFTSHVTGTATRIGIDFGVLELPEAMFFTGLLFSFIGGGALATIIWRKRGFIASISFAGMLLVFVGICAPPEIKRLATDQFIFGFLASTAMGAQNASTALTPLGKTTHVTGASTELGMALVKGDHRSAGRFGSLIAFFIIGSLTAFFVYSAMGLRGFILPGLGLTFVALIKKY